jgi:hypothetical protein
VTLLYASTFAQSLDRLTSQEQKQVKVTTVDLMLDPKGNGLQLHRVEKSDGFWTARVNQDLRIVLHRDGARTLLAYVDHHDDAYRWAERRRLLPHERTGAMQFVEIIERQEERLVASRLAVNESDPLPVRRPFASLSDDQLLDVGVPREWLEPVRETDETSVDGLFGSLPGEAAEALLDYATGGKLEDHVIAKAVPGADPFTHPDALRRFRTVEGVEELKAALDAPFARWAVFLHPAQRAPVERHWSGPARISGSAGTGKTIVALHRAVQLARPADSRVLLTTFSEPLAKALATKVALMTEAEPGIRSRLFVRSLDEAAAELYRSTFGDLQLASAEQIRLAIADAQSSGLGTAHSVDFLFDEWDELVDAWGLHDPEGYATVPRLGRKVRLGPHQRAEAWSVFAYVRNQLGELGLTTWADIYGRLTADFASRQFAYTHVVVDEAQDLSVAQARFLAVAGRGIPEALFFTGDLGQRIFHLPFSWLALGVDIRGRSQTLKICYRTSHQIRELADRLLTPEIIDQDGMVEARRGTVSVFDGPEPTIDLASDPEAEIASVGNWLRQCVADGIPPAEMAVLVRSKRQLDRGAAVARAIDDTVHLLTMHEAKGLEFRAVAVMALDEDVLPDAERLAQVGDFGDLEAIQDTERHLLYVASTRARDRVHLSGVAPGSEFLDDLRLSGR